MNCEQVTPYLPGIAGGELGADTIRWIDAHLATCASCRRDAVRYRSVSGGLSAIAEREIEPPAFMVDAILERVESERRRRMIPIPPTVIPAELIRLAQENRDALTSAAGVALAAGAAYALWRTMRSSRFRTAT
jgi:anti-sigma factor RsiW